MKLVTLLSTFLPDEVYIQIIALLITLSGFLMIIGMRKTALTLLGSSILLGVLPAFDPVIESLFLQFPPWVFWVMFVITGLIIFRSTLEFIVGKEATDVAVGDLIASAIKSILALPFRILRWLIVRK